MVCASRAAPRLVDIIDAIYEGQDFFERVRTAADLMNPIRSLPPSATLADGLRFMNAQHARHVVLVSGVELAGIVSQRDLARFLSPWVGTARQTREDADWLVRPLSVIASRPVTADTTTTLSELIDIFLRYKFDSVPVLKKNGHVPIGIVTTTDVIRCFVRLSVLRSAREAKSSHNRLIDIISDEDVLEPEAETFDGIISDLVPGRVITVKSDRPLAEARQLMMKHNFRHVPVEDNEGRLVGMISDRDILAVLPPLPLELVSNPNWNPHGFRERLFYLDEADPETARAIGTPIGDIMTTALVTVDPLRSISEVAELLARRKFGATPIVMPGTQALVGLVTQTDIIRAIAKLAAHANPNGRAQSPRL